MMLTLLEMLRAHNQYRNAEVDFRVQQVRILRVEIRRY